MSKDWKMLEGFTMKDLEKRLAQMKIEEETKSLKKEMPNDVKEILLSNEKICATLKGRKKWEIRIILAYLCEHIDDAVTEAQPKIDEERALLEKRSLTRKAKAEQRKLEETSVVEEADDQPSEYEYIPRDVRDYDGDAEG